MIPFRCTVVGYRYGTDQAEYTPPRKMVFVNVLYIGDNVTGDYSRLGAHTVVRATETKYYFVQETVDEIANAIEARVIK